MSFLGPYIVEAFGDQPVFIEIFADYTDISHSSPGTVNVADPMASGTQLLGFIVHVQTAFDTAASLTLGDNVTVDLYADASAVDLQTAGIYEIPVYSGISVLTQAKAYLALAGATVGAARIYAVLRGN